MSLPQKWTATTMEIRPRLLWSEIRVLTSFECLYVKFKWYKRCNDAFTVVQNLSALLYNNQTNIRHSWTLPVPALWCSAGSCVYPWQWNVCWDNKSTECLLTCNDPGGDVKLSDWLGKWAGSHSKPAQDPSQHDCRSAAKFLHQHATKGTCGSNLMLLV